MNYPELILIIPVLWMSVVLHEVAHGYIALKAGDDTASLMGRLTLNPIAHIDPIGTILVPAILGFLGLPVFGWAKPVPINPLKFKNSDWLIWVSLAGIIVNFCLVIISTIMLKILHVFHIVKVLDTSNAIFLVFFFFIQINLVLGFFNLLPIPPLDGSKVLYQLLYKLNIRIDKYFVFLERFGFIILLIALQFGLFEYILSPIINFILGIIFMFLG